MSRIIPLLCVLLSAAGNAFGGSFGHAPVFAERPRTADGWHAGLRTRTGLAWDLFVSHPSYGVIDYQAAGMPGNEHISDWFWLAGYRSPVYARTVRGIPYAAAAGAKLYQAAFGVDGDIIRDRSYILYATQEIVPTGRHAAGLFASWSFRPRHTSAGTRTEHTWYLVPSYEYRLAGRWTAELEYYLTNTRELPIKSFQFVYDEDKLDFYNAGREPVSFMVWGVSYARDHFRAGLHLLSHYTLRGLVFPLAGIGWQF